MQTSKGSVADPGTSLDVIRISRQIPRQKMNHLLPPCFHFISGAALINSPLFYHPRIISTYYLMMGSSAPVLPSPRAWRAAVDVYKKGYPVLFPFHAARLHYGSPCGSALKLKRKETSIAGNAVPPSSCHHANPIDDGRA